MQTSEEEYEVKVKTETGVDTQLVTENKLTEIVGDLHTLSNTLRL